jgi:hypothetical protein
MRMRIAPDISVIKTLLSPAELALMRLRICADIYFFVSSLFSIVIISSFFIPPLSFPSLLVSQRPLRNPDYAYPAVAENPAKKKRLKKRGPFYYCL